MLLSLISVLFNLLFKQQSSKSLPKESIAQLRKANEQLQLEIAQYKRAEAMRDSEALYRSVVQQIAEGIFLVDVENKRILEANTAFANLLGYTLDELLELTLYDIIALDREMLELNVQLFLQEKNLFLGEAPHRRHDGTLIYAEVNLTVILYGGREVFCVVAHDVTERRQTDEALCSSMATNRALLNAIPDLMVRINREGFFVNFKAAKDNNLFLPQGEFLGQHLNDVFSPEVAQPIASGVARALLTGNVQIVECQMQSNNNLRDYEVRIAISSANEVMAIVRDITERKRAEAEIRSALAKEKELGELKSRFITMASHEFRTPLTTILSSAELLEHYSHKLSEEKKLNHLQRIQSSVKHMTELLNDVLLIGKVEAGKLELKPTLIHLSQFCHHLVEEIQLATSDRKIVFYTNSPRTTAYLDEKLLRQILGNLLSNAIKYSPAGSTVKFDLSCGSGQAILHVQDEGIGIPEPEQAQIFNSFHRASNVGTISGTGLGLAIVKKSVDLHNGKITFESAVGTGTTFTVTLPLNQQG